MNHVINQKLEALRGQLAEAAGADPVSKAAKRIADKTNWNDHTGAILELAKLLKADKWVKVLAALGDLHIAWGALPPGANEIRSISEKELWHIADSKLTPEQVSLLKGAF